MYPFFLQVAMAKLLRWIAPQFPVATLDLSLVCSCPEQVKIMERDPFRFHGFCKAGFGASLIDACKVCKNNCILNYVLTKFSLIYSFYISRN